MAHCEAWIGKFTNLLTNLATGELAELQEYVRTSSAALTQHGTSDSQQVRPALACQTIYISNKTSMCFGTDHNRSSQGMLAGSCVFPATYQMLLWAIPEENWASWICLGAKSRSQSIWPAQKCWRECPMLGPIPQGGLWDISIVGLHNLQHAIASIVRSASHTGIGPTCFEE